MTAFISLFMWPFAAVMHLVFQVLVSRLLGLVWRPARMVRWMVLNVPILALIVWALLDARGEPARAFAYFVADPIPKKVRVLQFGRSQGIGEPMRLGLAFQIDETDLLNVLESGGYVPAASPTDQEEADFLIQSVSHGTGVKAEWGSGCQYYTSTNHPGWHLLWRTNESLVFFFLSRSPG